MKTDIADIHKFYDSPLGKLAQKYIRQKIALLWPEVAQDTVAGYGYPLPYVEQYKMQAEQIAVLMPCFQGASLWPENGASLVALTPPDILPLKDNSVNRLIIVHGLEHSENPGQLLREAWRILTDGGCVLMIIPNRQGFWARNPRTPFGIGKPYSGPQLHRLIGESLFTLVRLSYALFMLPTQLKVALAAADTFEYIGSGWTNRIGGVILAEARKQIIAPVSGCPKVWRPGLFVPRPSSKNFS